MNRIILIGRLATDPELKYTPSGAAVTEFRLAVDRSFKNASGERETDFFTVKTWKEHAEFVANYFHKGRRAAVDGRIEIRSWVAQDGTKRYSTEVIAERVEFVDSPPDHERGPRAPGEPPAYGARQPSAPADRAAAAEAAPSAPAERAAAPEAAPATGEPDYGDPFADQ